MAEKNSTPLVLLGCLHAGFKYANLKYTEEVVNWGKRNGALFLILGDNFENAIATHNKAMMMWDQLTTPDSQIDYVEKLLKPVRKQIVGACSSNHSKRTKEVAGVDLDWQLACRLGYRHIYNANTGYRVLKVGKSHYRIVYTHGIGSGSNVLADFRKLNAMYPNADIIAASHTHTCLSTREAFFTMDNRGRKLNEVVYIRTGSGIGYPTYAEDQLYKPQPMGYSVAWLGRDEKSVRVDTYFKP